MTASTTENGFWVMRAPVPVTLCDRHALDAMNRVFRFRGSQPVQTFSEGIALIAALAAAAGVTPNLPTYTETGACQQCAEEGLQ